MMAEAKTVMVMICRGWKCPFSMGAENDDAVADANTLEFGLDSRLIARALTPPARPPAPRPHPPNPPH